MQTMPHGGECCGVSHIFEFNSNSLYTPFLNAEERKKALDREIEETIEEFEDENAETDDDGDRLKTQPWGKKFGRLFEICLTDDQMMVWAPILKEKGFRLGQRFKNDNSGNYVTLLTYVTKRPAHKAPYKW